VIVLARLHTPNRILIEKVGPGLHLVQDFKVNPERDVPVPIGIVPEGSKIDRMAAQSARFHAGQVYLPEQAPWLADYLDEILGFPNVRYDDQVDSTSQFLNWAEISSRRFSLPDRDYNKFPLVQYFKNGILLNQDSIMVGALAAAEVFLAAKFPALWKSESLLWRNKSLFFLAGQ
jgi:hypothetical protein